MFKVLNWYIHNDIGFLELNNPPSNPMNVLFFEEFYWWRTEIIEKSNVKSLIIHGNGRHFSSGAVLDDLLGIISRSYGQSGDIHKISKFLNKNSAIFYSLKALNFPVIAAIRGVCVGSAFELALCADYIVCGEKAVLGLPETTFGLIPGCTGSYVLPNVTNKARAMELILSGKTYSAKEACEWGIVHEVTPTKSVLETAISAANRLSYECAEDFRAKEFQYKKTYLK